MYFDSTFAQYLAPNFDFDDDAKFRAEYYAERDARKHQENDEVRETNPTEQEGVIRAGILARFSRFVPLM